MGKYKIIYAAPPWYYSSYADKTASRWVGNQYPVMSAEDICRLPIAALSADASVHQIVFSPVLTNNLLSMQEMGELLRTELFARQKVEGWDCWGNEMESDIEL